jgi:hypothetical protein
MERLFEEKKPYNYQGKTSNELLNKLIKKRDRYLKENPHLIPFQEEIDRLLDNAGSQENRMKVLGIMMESKLTELREKLLSLSKMLSSPDQ